MFGKTAVGSTAEKKVKAKFGLTYFRMKIVWPVAKKP